MVIAKNEILLFVTALQDFQKCGSTLEEQFHSAFVYCVRSNGAFYAYRYC